MSVSIRILNGKRQGEVFKIQDGLLIGRKAPDLSIRDPKMSAQHIVIEQGEDGVFVAKDLGSRNKILFEGKILEKLKLHHGTRFGLGETEFEIIHDSEVKTDKELLIDHLKELAPSFKNEPKKLYAFSDKIQLDFISGPDQGSSHYLGYGPRSAGKNSFDIFISEHFEKENLFQIIETDKKYYLVTDYPDLLLVNENKATTENLLESEARIRFANSELVFKLLE